MSKQLLKAKDVAKRLNISMSNFYRIRTRLIAKGLKCTTIGGGTKYLESSLEELAFVLSENILGKCLMNSVKQNLDLYFLTLF
jgi:predicted transcriptional regulator